MKKHVIARCLLACCLLLALSGCGNKGPLVLPEEEEEEKSESVIKGEVE
jgi:predicted small lipoprotein YifL